MGLNWGDESEDVGEPQQVAASEFKQLLCGYFETDKRQDALHERLLQYYKDTPDSMNNRDAMVHWKAFKKWCNDHGYTQVEINRAKMNVAHRAT